jgi:excisionase family DNA binding protein
MSTAPQPASSTRQLHARLLRTKQAAAYLGIGEKALRLLIVQGELPYVQMRAGNSPFLLDVRDLDRFIESRKMRAS